MNNYEQAHLYFTNMSFNKLLEINDCYHLDIQPSHLKEVHHILCNNIPALLDSHYYDVLYNYIEKKTSKTTCLKIRHLIDNNYFNESLNV